MASRPHRENPPGLVLGERIGKGSFATVYKGRVAADGAQVAIKIVQRAHLKRDKRLLDNFEAEMAILKRMKHPHVVSLIEVVQTPHDFNLVMEYCSLGDLSRFIRKRGHLSKTTPSVAEMLKRYPEPPGLCLHDAVVRHFLAQLAAALAFLRDHDLIHRDIKPQNLLLRPACATPEEFAANNYVGASWDLPVLKIADFGFARFLPAASMAETLCGSPLYMAPEILHYEKYNATADLWSVGAVAFEMAVGRPPFPAANHMELIKKIDEARDVVPFPPELQEGDVRDIISRLLRRLPADRMTFAEFFAHPAVQIGSEEQTQPAQNVLPQAFKGIERPYATNVPNLKEKRSATTPISHTEKPPAVAFDTFGVDDPRPRWLPGALGLLGTTPPETAIESSPEPETEIPLRSTHHNSDDSSEYVVIEKRTVEVNALADRMQQPAPHTSTHGTSQRERVMRSRRLSSIAYGASPTTALAQALIKSSARLFARKPTGDHAGTTSPSGCTREVVDELEQLATIGKVVSLYADVKFAQLPAGGCVVAAEALTLYVKALSVLARAMDRAGQWWDPSTSGSELMGGSAGVVGSLVQWIRDKFNECVERAEETRNQVQAQGGSEDDVQGGAEKLLFERAVEMARAAAVQELNGGNRIACETNYGTAVWMLRALLVADGDEELSADDRIMVDKLMAKIAQRVSGLKAAPTATQGGATSTIGAMTPP